MTSIEQCPWFDLILYKILILSGLFDLFFHSQIKRKNAEVEMEISFLNNYSNFKSVLPSFPVCLRHTSMLLHVMNIRGLICRVSQLGSSRKAEISFVMPTMLMFVCS